ncbi:SRPBCC family protein [Alteromonas sp. ASW11-19]|uniref:SRPBCC family protein n=1 Tax=Alteromonas salexigens TaxID=2982530 RepID=A0ABT2VKG6_9ALTE|nr:SRPBCC family protein [Alteromonas salexigens]MCU7553771.1 SRPBCC family protein [Alteromonas salexigens]
MQVSRSIDIQAPQEVVWSIITDIENAQHRISGIKEVEILKPATGPSITGLKWRETREMMGKDATEEMWITQASAPDFYEAEAASHGAVYTSRLELSHAGGTTALTMHFDGKPETFMAKIIWALTGWMAKSALKKTIDQDLKDIKAVAEASKL